MKQPVLTLGGALEFSDSKLLVGTQEAGLGRERAFQGLWLEAHRCGPEDGKTAGNGERGRSFADSAVSCPLGQLCPPASPDTCRQGACQGSSKLRLP